MKRFLKYILLLACIVCADDYDRKRFKHWIDEDGDCQDTRQEVLIQESHAVAFDGGDNCKVKMGIWVCKYNDTIIYNPSGLDVDHVVPLKDAWMSGAYKWDKKKREKFANFLDDPDHLIAVSRSANRSKGAKAPHEWMPKNKKFRKEYLLMWCQVKVEWGLTASKEELAFLKSSLRGEDVVFPVMRE